MTIKKLVYKSTEKFDINSQTIKTVPNKNKSKQKPPLDDIGYSLEPKSVFRDRTWNIGNVDKSNS